MKSLQRFVSIVACVVMLAFAPSAQAETLLLWPQGAPGAASNPSPETVRVTELGEHVVSNVHAPSLTPYLPAPASATGAAVIVLPGGGHRELWMDHEGHRVGEWLSARGVAAFVLKYRLSRAPGSSYSKENSLADVARAIRLVRSRAGEWRVAPDRVGVMGFSAGGELAALAGMRLGEGAADAADRIERLSAKPSFMALIYPGLPSEPVLSAQTPPAFLLAGAQDRPEIAEGLPRFYLALRAAGASAELHILAGAPHGFGVRASNPVHTAAWLQMFRDWLDAQGFTSAR